MGEEDCTGGRIESLELQLHEFQGELERARTIQRIFLPKRPKLDGLSTMTIYKPAKYVGGDYYDFHVFDDHTLGVLIADVMGHGTGAGLVMSRLSGAFSLVASRSSVETLIGLDSALPSMNENPGARYATAAYGVIDREKLTFTYTVAGHVPIVILHEEAEPKYLKTERATRALAMGKGNRPELTVDLSLGDQIVFFTDGCFALTAEESCEETCAEDHFYEALNKCSKKPGQFLNLYEDIKEFSEKRTDDVTIVVVNIEEYSSQ